MRFTTDAAAARKRLFTGRATRIAQILAVHAATGGDVGDRLAAACRDAARRLDGAVDEHGLPHRGGDALVAGRPGSWEADHVRALAGGWEYSS